MSLTTPRLLTAFVCPPPPKRSKRGEKITIWHLPPVCSHDGFHNRTVYIRCALHNHFFHLIRKISIWRGRPESRARVMSCLSPLGKDLPLSQSPPLFILFSYSSTYLFHELLKVIIGLYSFIWKKMWYEMVNNDVFWSDWSFFLQTDDRQQPEHWTLMQPPLFLLQDRTNAAKPCLTWAFVFWSFVACNNFHEFDLQKVHSFSLEHEMLGFYFILLKCYLNMFRYLFYFIISF